MVALTEIATRNAAFAGRKTQNKVCVFVGATSGIGERVLSRMITMFDQPEIYIIGRSGQAASKLIDSLKSANGSAKLTFIEQDITRLTNVDAACRQVTSSHVDYLYMSPGYLPKNGPVYTPEGLEQCFVLSYLARLRFVTNLLPQLRAAPSASILSVLGAGSETTLNEEDLFLEYEKNWAIRRLIFQTTTLTSLAFCHLAQKNPSMRFVHVGPGLVNLDRTNRAPTPGAAGILWQTFLTLMTPLLYILRMWDSTDGDECGERQVYHMTDDSFAPGFHRLDKSSSPSSSSQAYEDYIKTGWAEKTFLETKKLFHRKVGNGVMT